MTDERVKEALSQCLSEVLNNYLFELDTEESRQLILYEFIDKCAESGHGVEAELVIEDYQLKGVEYIHESGLHGKLSIQLSVTPENE